MSSRVASERLLNYGHTLAHALEVLAFHRDRDEFVMAKQSRLALASLLASLRLGRVDAAVIANHDEVLKALGLAARVPDDLAMSTSLLRHGSRQEGATRLNLCVGGSEGSTWFETSTPEVVATVLEEFRGEQ